jgi:primosomal protein N' (replication factor Y)
MGNLYVNVALPVPINKLFTYIVPDDLKSDVAIGKRVIVPFGKQELTGIIVEVSNESAWHKLKEIKDVLDPKPIFSDEMLRLTRWISDYYFSSWGEVLKSALPYGTILEGKRTVKLIREVDQETLSHMEKTAPKKAELLKFLISRKKQTITIKSLKNTLKLRNIYSLLNSLESLGYIEIENRLPEQKAKVKLEKFVSIAESYRENLNKLTAQINELEKKSPKQVDILLFLLDQLKKGKFEIALS